jgi:hypothetical protein
MPRDLEGWLTVAVMAIVAAICIAGLGLLALVLLSF